MKRLVLFVLLVAMYMPGNNASAQFLIENYTEGQRDTMEHTELYFVGTGDIQQNISQIKDDIAASTGVGVIFWRMFGKKLNFLELQLEARISIASTVDTIQAKYQANSLINMREFGSYILAPLVRGQATTINTLWYFADNDEHKPINKWIDGFQIDFIAANQVFKDSVTSINASVLGLKAGVFHEFVPTYNRLKQGYSIRLGVNYILRGVRGDLGTSSPQSTVLRKSLLGVSERLFHGPEFLLAFKLKNLKAQAALPVVFSKQSGSTFGLTGTQFITTISFIGGFPLRL